MDAALLARLPDAAKLGILQHLAAGAGQQGQQQPAAALPQRQPSGGGDGSGVPGSVAGRIVAGGVAIVDAFLSPEEVQAAREEARAFLAGHAREEAGMAAAEPGRRWASAGVRGDTAAWLPSSGGELEAGGHPHLAAAQRRLAALAPWLASQGFDVGGRPSFQLACYPGGGARYVRHRDASGSVPHRTATCILYLNAGWQPQHGGALAIYDRSASGTDPRAASAADLQLAAAGRAAGGQPAPVGSSADGGSGADGGHDSQHRQQHEVRSGVDEGHPATVVPPVGGRLVVMDARLLHEVLPSEAERLAITAWFPRSPRPPAAAAAAGGERPQQQDQAQQQQDQVQQEQQQASSSPLQQLPRAPRPLNAGSITSPGAIFVSVPAHRDAEARWTLADLFAKAAEPQRVHACVVWQVELPADAGLMRLEGDQRWLGQARVRQVVLPASEAAGPCKARALAEQLWAGEEFVLQVDAHMRFEPGWDASLLRMLRQAERAAGHPRVVLSAYPHGYEGAGADAVLPPTPLPAVLCAGGWGEGDGLLRLVGRKLREPLAAPAPSLFWAAGLSFSRAQLLLEAPYCSDLPGLFFGEETLQLMRMWRRGWDVFTPHLQVACHQWSRAGRPSHLQGEQQPADEQQRRKDEERPKGEQRRRSQQRVVAALAGEEGGAGGCDGGGAPPVRSLQQFWEWTGVDFRSRAISERARCGGLPLGAFLAASPAAP